MPPRGASSSTPPKSRDLQPASLARCRYGRAGRTRTSGGGSETVAATVAEKEPQAAPETEPAPEAALQSESSTRFRVRPPLEARATPWARIRDLHLGCSYQLPFVSAVSRDHHFTTLRSSSREVSPFWTLSHPSIRRPCIPLLAASLAISDDDARVTASRSISSVTTITSWRANRPR